MRGKKKVNVKPNDDFSRNGTNAFGLQQEMSHHAENVTVTQYEESHDELKKMLIDHYTFITGKGRRQPMPEDKLKRKIPFGHFIRLNKNESDGDDSDREDS
jgi:hypothetical protein